MPILFFSLPYKERPLPSCALPAQTVFSRVQRSHFCPCHEERWSVGWLQPLNLRHWWKTWQTLASRRRIGTVVLPLLPALFTCTCFILIFSVISVYMPLLLFSSFFRGILTSILLKLTLSLLSPVSHNSCVLPSPTSPSRQGICTFSHPMRPSTLSSRGGLRSTPYYDVLYRICRASRTLANKRTTQDRAMLRFGTFVGIIAQSQNFQELQHHGHRHTTPTSPFGTGGLHLVC